MAVVDLLAFTAGAAGSMDLLRMVASVMGGVAMH
jgi:hypothetical protein